VNTVNGSMDPTLTARRAVEALRAGVPSRDAVAALGSGQSAIEDRFQALCEGVRGAAGGLLLGGGFGLARATCWNTWLDSPSAPDGRSAG
jgi:hypothetical protein